MLVNLTTQDKSVGNPNHRLCKNGKSNKKCERRRSSSVKGSGGGQQQLPEQQQQLRQLVSSCGCVHSMSGGPHNIDEMVNIELILRKKYDVFYHV